MRRTVPFYKMPKGYDAEYFAGVYFCLSNIIFAIFLKEILFQDDMKTVDTTIRETRADIKKTVDSLMQIEGAQDLADRGFNLDSINEEITE